RRECRGEELDVDAERSKIRLAFGLIDAARTHAPDGSEGLQRRAVLALAGRIVGEAVARPHALERTGFAMAHLREPSGGCAIDVVPRDDADPVSAFAPFCRIRSYG